MRNLVVFVAICAAAYGSHTQIAASAVSPPDKQPGSSQSKGETPENPLLASINIPGSPSFKPDQPVVLAPKLIKQVDPEFSRQAPGVVALKVIIDDAGLPRNVRVVESVGHGFDQAAIAAVKQWRFAPATRDGKPVAVELQVEVNFRRY